MGDIAVSGQFYQLPVTCQSAPPFLLLECLDDIVSEFGSIAPSSTSTVLNVVETGDRLRVRMALSRKQIRELIGRISPAI